MSFKTAAYSLVPKSPARGGSVPENFTMLILTIYRVH